MTGSTTKRQDCEHCERDPDCSTVLEAFVQLGGVWLCQYHLDRCETIGGYVLRPVGERDADSWAARQARTAIANERGDREALPRVLRLLICLSNSLEAERISYTDAASNAHTIASIVQTIINREVATR